MDIKRVLRHLTTTSLAARRAFPAPVLAAIAQAIQASEQTHGGQIRFVVEACLDGMSLWRVLSGQGPISGWPWPLSRFWSTRDFRLSRLCC